MTRPSIAVISSLLVFSCSSKKEIPTAPPFVDVTACTPTKPIGELKNEFDYREGLYGEKFTGNHDEDLINYDNCIYTPERNFVFDYIIIRDNDSLKIKAPFAAEEGEDHQTAWDFIPHAEDNPEKINTLSIEVGFGIANQFQTPAKFRYHSADDPNAHGFSSTSGIVENQMNVWMHPHRDIYFRILELNPFPFIQRPFEIGQTWAWRLPIGDFWGDKRWKTWNGTVINDYEYKIIGKEKITTGIGELDCWVIDATAQSTIGTTRLKAHFSEQYGFAKLNYTNIDGSKTILILSEVK